MIDAVVDYYINSHYLSGSERWSWPWGKSTVADSLEDPNTAPDLHLMLGAANRLIDSIGGLFGNSLDTAVGTADAFNAEKTGDSVGNVNTGGGSGGNKGGDKGDTNTGGSAGGSPDGLSGGSRLGGGNGGDKGKIDKTATGNGSSPRGTSCDEAHNSGTSGHGNIMPVILDLDGDGVEIAMNAQIGFGRGGLVVAGSVPANRSGRPIARAA